MLWHQMQVIISQVEQIKYEISVNIPSECCEYSGYKRTIAEILKSMEYLELSQDLVYIQNQKLSVSFCMRAL